MAVALTGSAAFSDGQSAVAAATTGTIPATAAIGDTGMFIVVQNSGTATFTAPTGWTLLAGPNDSAANCRDYVWVKDLVSGDPGSSVTWTSSVTGSRIIGVMTTYSGTAAASITTPTPTLVVSNTTTITQPNATTTVDNSWIVGLWVVRLGAASPSPTLTHAGTQTFDIRSRTAFSATPNYTIEATHLTTLTVAGAYTGQSATASATTTNQNAYSVIIPPNAVVTSAKPPPTNRARFRASLW